MKYYWLFPLLLAAGSLSGANLLRNGSFELGSAEYGCVRYLELDGDLDYLPPVADENSAAVGKRSLRIENPGNDGVHFFSHEFELEPDREYVFRFRLKTDKPGFPVRVLFLSTARMPDARVDWIGHETTVLPASDWREYELRMTPKSGHRYYQIDLRYGNNSGGATLWLDGFQVVSADAATTQWQPFAPVEAVIAGPSGVQESAVAPVSLEAVNYTREPRSISGELRWFDDYRNLPLGNGERFTLEIAPESTASRRFPSAIRQCGVFRAEASGADWDALAYTTGVIEPVAGDVPAGRRAAIEASFMDGNFDLSRKRRSFKAQGAGMTEYWRERRLGGIRLLRVGNFGRPFLWAEMETEPGVFDWRETDRLVAAAEASGIELMPVLGGALIHYKGNTEPARVPEYLLKPEFLSDDNLKLHNCFRVRPPLEAWERYIRAVAERYRGRIHRYEIVNEPNLYLAPEDYCRYLQSAYRILKEVDPGISVVGMTVTSDHGADYRFIDQCGPLGAFAFLDAVSFHPYGSRSDNTPVRAQENIAALRGAVDRYRQNVPLWNSELYFLGGTTNDTVEATRARAHQYWRRILVDAGCGVEQSILVPDYYLYRDDRHPNWAGSRHYLVRRNLPSEIFIAHNAVARLLGGATAAGELKLKNGALGYRFRTPAGMLAAVWLPDHLEKAALRVPGGDGAIEVFDLFGNRVATENGDFTLPLTADPWFFRGDTERLDRAEVVASRPFSLGGVAFGRDGKMEAEFYNRTTRELQLEIVCGGENVSLKLAPEARGVARFAAPEKNGTVEFTVNRENVSAELAPVRFCGDGERVFLADGSSFSAAWREAGFAVTVDVRDDERAARRSAPWDNDAVELFFDAAPAVRASERGWNPRVGRVTLIAAASGELPRMTADGLLDGVQSAWSVVDTPEGFRAELLVPRAAFDGEIPAFDVTINHAEGDHGRTGMTVWSGTDRNYMDRSRFGRLANGRK